MLGVEVEVVATYTLIVFKAGDEFISEASTAH